MQSKILPFLVIKTREIKPGARAEGLISVSHDKGSKLYFILAC